ncbi:MAG: hypothetical protein LBC75_12740 [Fibromonadaceae bacterium]|jgi:hypothetical protein|nr:hypothetical protein [Fibromonadaceae bacterium]
MAKIIRNSALAATFVLALVFTLSCSGGKDWLNNIAGQLTSITASNLLQNPSLGFMSNAPGVPDGEVDVIKNVEISGSALSGGSVLVTVTSSEKLEELYLQIEGEDGYYVWTLEPEDLISSNPYVYQIALEFNKDLEGGEKDDPKELEFIVSGKTAKGDVVEPKQKELKTVKAGTGALQISLSWDKNHDVDLHVFSPSEHLYFNNLTIEATEAHGKAELDIDSNRGCIIDGVNSENIFFEAPLEDGDYKVEVRVYEKCNTGAGAKYRVTANLKGKFVEFSENQSGQFADTDDDDYKVVIGTIKIRDGECTNCN